MALLLVSRAGWCMTRQRCGTAGWVPGGVWAGGYTGWVIRALPSYPGPTPARSQIQRSGPRKPCRAGVGGIWGRPRRTVRPSTWDHPLRTPGPPGPASLSQALSPSKAASGPIRARIRVISWKLSKNRGVSPKCVEKASHSPYISKRCPNVTS